MAKENWSARIERELKKELQEFLKNSNNTNEDVVIQGYEALKKLQGLHCDSALKVTSADKNIFTGDVFDINLFQELDISNINRSNLQYMLSRISFWKPYQTLLKIKNSRYLFVKEVDSQFDAITFGVVGEELESVISLQRIINEVENIEKIFELRVG
ncbi:MAG: hypothetical protein RBR59_00290 [Sulfurimonadaceae bacterium]|jgi:anthranilate/para-aminobenzoate synthase component I|nr:hypothetical protein [Sulfurimonadaceae bacterium]